MSTLSVMPSSLALSRKIPRMLRQFLEEQEGTLASVHVQSPQLVACIINQPGQQQSTIVVYRDQNLTTMPLAMDESDEHGQAKWRCRCGAIHLLDKIKIIYVTPTKVRVTTGRHHTASTCTPMKEEWLVTIAARTSATSRKRFRKAARQAMDNTRNRLLNRTHDHQPSQIIMSRVDAQLRYAWWWLHEHICNEEYVQREGVPIWSRAKFRHSLWSMTADGNPQLMREQVVTVHRLPHRWSVFQRNQRRLIVDDLFVVVPDAHQRSTPPS